MLDKRLDSVLNLINCKTLLDIGCDHGKLSVEAMLSGKAQKVIAVDISAKSLEKAKRLAQKHNLTNIDFIVSNGFDKVKEKPDLTVIAGMGGFEIIKILERNHHTTDLILVAHHDEKNLREYLNGKYLIKKDFVVEASERFYSIIYAVSGASYYKEEELYFGFIDRENQDFNHYITSTKERVTGILEKVKSEELLKMLEMINSINLKIKDVVKVMEEFAPLELASNFDNCGLAYGNQNVEITGILVTLDTNLDVIAEAKAQNCNLIIEHHPILFNSIKQFDLRYPNQMALVAAIKNDIAIYSAHTNVDYTKGGLNDYLAEILDLKDIKTVKDYSSARVGNLEDETTLAEFKKIVSSKLQDRNLQTIGNLNRKIKRVALINGGGGGSSEVVLDNIACGADVFLTADIKYNVARLSKDLDYAIISYGHYTSEIFFMELIKKLLKNKLNIDVYKAKNCVNPYN